MARFSKDHATRSISVGPAIAAGTPFENSGKTPANGGGATGAGDEFVYVPETGPGFEYPVNVAWDITGPTGGTLTAFTAILEFSDDGTNWFQVDTTSAAGRKVVSNQVPRMMRINITVFTVASGTPILTGGITV
jgi:hypothetical protein